jgi:hypothetical protein
MQTAGAFNPNDFYVSAGINENSRTNRGTLLLRPSNNSDVRSKHLIDSSNYSNVLTQNSLAYSANKSFNTPTDVYCESDPDNFGGSWGNYACAADFYVPQPIGAGDRNMKTNFLVVSLPYGRPETDIAVKMYSCMDAKQPISKKMDNDSGSKVNNCTLVEFANVQPMVDSTGRANDLFRRVESRIELADTSFPISNYALAVDDPNGKGVSKSFYVTADYSNTPKGKCTYTTSYWNNSTKKVEASKDIKDLWPGGASVGNPTAADCATASGANGQ